MTDCKKIIRASNVFIDTEVFIGENFNYESSRLASLQDLAVDGRISIFLTEITLNEIRANIRQAIARAGAARPQPIFRNCVLPKVRALFDSLDIAAIENDLLGQLEAFIKRAKITVLPLGQSCLGPVLESYFDHLPPFGPGKNKSEFPDALALETLKEWCRTQERGMAVVTRDKGVQAACVESQVLFHFEDLPQYLDTVSSENEALSAFIRSMVPDPDHDIEVFEIAKEAFAKLGFFLKDQEGDVDNVELVNIDYDGDIEIISLAGEEAVVEMPATLTFAAGITYCEPGTGYYDGDEGAYYLQQMRESRVTRAVHRSIAVAVTFKNLDPVSFQVQEVWIEGKQNIAVISDYDEDWPYK